MRKFEEEEGTGNQRCDLLFLSSCLVLQDEDQEISIANSTFPGVFAPYIDCFLQIILVTYFIEKKYLETRKGEEEKERDKLMTLLLEVLKETRRFLHHSINMKC